MSLAMMGKGKIIKNLTLIFAALTFAAGVLGASVVRTTAQTSPSFNLTPLVAGEKVIVDPSVDPETKKVDYYLAYPGMLPDNALYPLKMIRDRVLLFFTRDVVKRAEMFLLFADKRIGAAQILTEGGKPELGVETLTKAEKYLEKAVAQAEIAESEGKDTSVLEEKLIKASLKHDEILVEIKAGVPEEARSVIEKARETLLRGYEKLAGDTEEGGEQEPEEQEVE